MHKEELHQLLQEQEEGQLFLDFQEIADQETITTQANSTFMGAFLVSGGGGGGGGGGANYVFGGNGGSGAYGYWNLAVQGSTAYAYSIGAGGNAESIIIVMVGEMLEEQEDLRL